MTPIEFATSLIAYCSATRGSITSWGRTPAHNNKVGGVPDSAHLTWTGADVVYDTDDSPEWRNKIAARLGIKIIKEGDHDHLMPS